MRVLMLSDYYPPHVGGGVETVAEQLAKGLTHRGHPVQILTLRTRGGSTAESDGLLSIRRAAAIDLTDRLGFQFALSLSVLPALCAAVRSFKPDLIHAHNLFFRTTESAALAKRFLGRPLILSVHLAAMHGGGRLLRLLVAAYENTMGRCALRSADEVTAVSQSAANHAERLMASDRAVTVIPNGVDSETFRPGKARAEQPIILFVGRLVPNKGPEVLLRAAPRVLERHQDARFVFVGDGPMRQQLNRVARELNVERSVAFLGHRSDVPTLMQTAAAFARPSTLEGMPLTVLEAMACALPTVATRVGGSPELIRDGETGYLVEPGDDAGVASKLIQLLDSPEQAARMGENARRAVEQSYSWTRVVDRTEALYQSVVGRWPAK